MMAEPCPETGIDERICCCANAFHYRGRPTAARAADPVKAARDSFDQRGADDADRLRMAAPVLNNLLHSATDSQGTQRDHA